MSSRTRTSESTNHSSDISTLSEWIRGADRIVVGAGSGLSASAGMSYSEKRFEDNFSDFRKVYGFTDMYCGGFARFRTPEEKWGFWSRMIMLNRYLQEDNGTYGALKEILEGRDYFVITSNVDHCFQKFGFDRERLFYMQGDYGLWQCSVPCHSSTYDNEESVRRMYLEQDGLSVPSNLVPRCPKCGKPMEMNLRCDGSFVQDAGWYAAARRFSDYIRDCGDVKTLYLELGVGYSTPGLIKYPFWEAASSHPNHRYACVNLDCAAYPRSLGERALGIEDDIGTALKRTRDLLRGREEPPGALPSATISL